MHVSSREASSSSKKQLTHRPGCACAAHRSYSNLDGAPPPKKRLLRNFRLE